MNISRDEVMKQKGTEAPFSGVLNTNKIDGRYTCGQCGVDLFSSDTKYESGSGWPSFTDVVSEDAVELIQDTSHGMIRTEAVCKACGGHLGHVFDDGPSEHTGKRYCINSASLDFKSTDKKTAIKGDGSA